MDSITDTTTTAPAAGEQQPGATQPLAPVAAPSTIATLLGFLSGKKTYCAAALAIIYFFGGSMGWWPIDSNVVGILSFLGLGFLRAGLSKSSSATAALILSAGLAVFMVGCTSTTSSIVKVKPDGSRDEIKFAATSFWDSKNDLGKYKASDTEKTRSIGFSDLSQETSSTNVIPMLDAVINAVIQAGVKAAKP
jgi:hypothetical protein